MRLRQISPPWGKVRAKPVGPFQSVARHATTSIGASSPLTPQLSACCALARAFWATSFARARSICSWGLRVDTPLAVRVRRLSAAQANPRVGVSWPIAYATRPTQPNDAGVSHSAAGAVKESGPGSGIAGIAGDAVAFGFTPPVSPEADPRGRSAYCVASHAVMALTCSSVGAASQFDGE